MVTATPAAANGKLPTTIFLLKELYLIVCVVDIDGLTSTNTVLPLTRPWVAAVETVTKFLLTSPLIIPL